jgi:hypothetical protein
LSDHTRWLFYKEDKLLGMIAWWLQRQIMRYYRSDNLLYAMRMMTVNMKMVMTATPASLFDVTFEFESNYDVCDSDNDSI